MRYDIVRKLYSNVVYTVGDIAYDENWNEIEYNIDLINAEIAKTEYQRQRASEYPSYADQFDLLYHGGYDAWKTAIQAVKDKYPKGEA